jgi:uracil-DNA glycosylase family 4
MTNSRKLTLLNEQKVVGCPRCPALVANRINTVFGEGDPNAQIVFCGEAPGQNENETGRPFVGRAGDLLDKIIAAMEWRREDIFILNIVKCQPPGNRVPTAEEAANCRPYLDMQLKIINPRYIVCWGKTASFYLLGKEGNIDHYKMADFRGGLIDWQGRKILCTYHPSYLLRTPSAKKDVWEDLQILKNQIALDLQPANSV